MILKREHKENSEKESDDNTIVLGFNGEICVACDETCVNITCHDSTWVANAGPSLHITPHMNLFSSYITGDYGCVKMDHGQSCKIMGIGDICLETELGCKLMLKRV